MEPGKPHVGRRVLDRIYTIGHSTRTLDELVALLRGSGVAALADIRRYPGSRRFPYFSKDSLEQALPESEILYRHLAALGGRRKSVPGSLNLGWRNDSFRAYADYMATEAFRAGIELLLYLPRPAALLCAEAVPWRCHRNLVADELTRRGAAVVHILEAGSAFPHEMNTMAQERDGHLVYPGEPRQASLPLAEV